MAEFVGILLSAAKVAFTVGGLFMASMFLSLISVERPVEAITASRRGWIESIDAALDWVYGPEFLERRAVTVSMLTTLLVVVGGFTSLLYGLNDGALRLEGNPGFWRALLILLTVNLVPDFLSLVQTRWLIKRHVEGLAPRNSLLLVLIDLLCSAVIGYSAIWLYCLSVSYPAPGLVELMAGFSLFSISFLSTFIGSFIAVGFALGIWAIGLRDRVFRESVPLLTRNPHSRIAWAGATVISLLVFLGAIPVVWLMRSDPDTLPPSCRWFPGQMCYQLGRFAETPEREFLLYGAGCDANDPAACAGMGRLLYDQAETDDDRQNAETLLARSCAETGTNGCGMLAEIKSRSDAGSAEELFREQCRRRSGWACERLAWLTLAQGDRDRDAEVADLIRQACEKGQEGACLSLSTMNLNGFGGFRDRTEARRLAREGCETGVAGACREFTRYAMLGIGGPPDKDMAFWALERSCADGEPLACYDYLVSAQDGGEMSFADQARAGTVRTTLESYCREDNTLACGAQTMLGYVEGHIDRVAALPDLLAGCDWGFGALCRFAAHVLGEDADTQAKPQIFDLLVMACTRGDLGSCFHAVRAFTVLKAADQGTSSDPLLKVIGASCSAQVTWCILSRESTIHTRGGYLKLGDVVGLFDLATADRIYRALASRFPDDFSLVAATVALTGHKGDPELAIAEGQVLLDRFASEPGTYFLLYQLYRRAGQPAEARIMLEAGLAVAPYDPLLGLEMARTLEADGDLSGAIDRLEILLNAGTGGTAVINNYVSLVLSVPADDIRRARALTLAPLLADEEDPAVRETYAWFLALSGDSEQAVPIYDAIADDFRHDPLVMAHQALAVLWSGDETRGRPLAEAAKARLPDHQKSAYELLEKALAGD